MNQTGIFVTKKELERVNVAQSCSGMCFSGGIPMGDPGAIVADLVKKYNMPTSYGLNRKTGEFVKP